MNCKRIVVCLAAVGLVCAMAVICVLSTLDDSATVDEPAHIAAGMVKLQEGDFRFYVEQPPLADALSAVLLIFGGHSIDKTGFEKKNHWNFGRRFLYDQGRDADAVLFLSRLPTMLIFAVLCVFFFFVVLRLTGSAVIAILGLVMLGFEPTMMAHARLATPDIACTAFIFFSAILFYLWLGARKKYLLVLVGMLTGLALLTKVSALILMPFFVIAAIICHSEPPIKSFEGRLREESPFSGLFIILFITLLTVYSTYACLIRDAYLMHEFGNDGLVTRLIAPFYEYSKTVGRIGGWAFHDYTQPQFLLGKYSLSGWWYYYPVAFVLKTPVVWTLLYIASLCNVLWSVIARSESSEAIPSNTLISRDRHVGLRLPRDDNKKVCLSLCIYANIFVAMFMAAAMISSLNIGVRYILPVYPFVILSICLFLSCLRLSKVRNAVVCIVLAVYCITVNLHNYPSYISAFNEFIASSKKDAYLVDSNLDWGQDLKRLSDWVQNNKVEELSVDYFGGGDIRYYLGPIAVPVNSEENFRPGYYAISRHYYRMSAYHIPDHSWETLARSAKHVATLGDSIYIFHLKKSGSGLKY